MATSTEPAPSSSVSPVPLSQFGPITPIISPTTPLPDANQLHPGASPLPIPTASYSASQPQQNVRYSTPYVFSGEQNRTLSVGQEPIALVPTGPPGSLQPDMSQIQSQPLLPIQPQPTAQMAYSNQPYPNQQPQQQSNQTVPGQLPPDLEAHRAAQLKAEKSARRKEQAKDCGSATCVGLGATCLAISAAMILAMECFVCFASWADACTYY